MRFLKRLFVLLILLIALAGVCGFLLPSKIHVQRSATIAAPINVVYEQVAVLENWERWSPWHKMFPETKYEYGSVSRGVGASYRWSGQKAGTGTLRIVAAEENKSLNAEIDYGPRRVIESWKFEPADGRVTVTWSLDANVGSNPVARYLGLLMGSQVGSAFEEGLGDLKRHCEGQQDAGA